MIKVEVTGVDGWPPAEPAAAEFDARGGSIGRGAGNALVLPDPQRRISRTQAAISAQGGQHRIRNVGSGAPILVNGQPLASGRDAAIRPGDVLRIGAYTLRVSSAGDPPGSAPEPGIRAAGAAAPGAATPGPGSEPAQPAGSPRPTRPDDLDLDLGLAASPAPPSIDRLFGLDAVGSGAPAFGSGHPLAEPSAGPQADADDPLAWLGPQARSSWTDPVQRDDAPELHGALALPESPRGDPPQPRAAVARTDRADRMFVSWEPTPQAPPGGIRTLIVPSRTAEPWPADPPAGQVDPPGPQRRAACTQPSPGTPARPDATPAPPPAPGAAGAHAPGVHPSGVHPSCARLCGDHPSGTAPSGSALQAAFLRGAGLPTLQWHGGLTSERMETIGRLLREATQGTLDLLAARAIAKRELRAQATVIVPRENNPLKFSPTVEAALAHLLAPQDDHGFMAPLRAMRDAHDDLRAHQLATMAGMRAALAGVLARFDPARLEGRLALKSVIDSVLPTNRKARLWDLFAALFAELSREAEDDFHALFGREFLRAYEAQLARLEAGRDDADRRGRPDRPDCPNQPDYPGHPDHPEHPDDQDADSAARRPAEPEAGA